MLSATTGSRDPSTPSARVAVVVAATLVAATFLVAASAFISHGALAQPLHDVSSTPHEQATSGGGPPAHLLPFCSLCSWQPTARCATLHLCRPGGVSTDGRGRSTNKSTAPLAAVNALPPPTPRTTARINHEPGVGAVEFVAPAAKTDHTAIPRACAIAIPAGRANADTGLETHSNNNETHSKMKNEATSQIGDGDVGGGRGGKAAQTKDSPVTQVHTRFALSTDAEYPPYVRKVTFYAAPFPDYTSASNPRPTYHEKQPRLRGGMHGNSSSGFKLTVR